MRTLTSVYLEISPLHAFLDISVYLVSVFSRFDRSFAVLDKVRIHKAFLVGLHYFRKSTNTWAIFLTPRYFHF